MKCCLPPCGCGRRRGRPCVPRSGRWLRTRSAVRLKSTPGVLVECLTPILGTALRRAVSAWLGNLLQAANETVERNLELAELALALGIDADRQAIHRRSRSGAASFIRWSGFSWFISAPPGAGTMQRGGAEGQRSPGRARSGSRDSGRRPRLLRHSRRRIRDVSCGQCGSKGAACSACDSGRGDSGTSAREVSVVFTGRAGANIHGEVILPGAFRRRHG